MSEPEHPRTLSREQCLRLSVLVHERSSAPRALVQEWCQQVQAILGVRVAVVGQRQRVVRLLSECPRGARALLSRADEPDSISAALASLGKGVSLWRHGEQVWTLVGVMASPDPPAAIAIDGDWTASAAELAILARGWMTSAPPELSADGRAAQRLAWSLADERGGLREMGQVILRHVVAAVPSRLGAFAVPAEEGGFLSIVATYGYPVALVESLRIAPGVGVIGETYQRARPLLVADTDRLQRSGRRSRYRSRSFLAVPVRAGGDVLGVLCITDKEGDQRYTERDLAVVSMMLAPAALALARERAERQAREYAQAAIVDPASRLFNRPYLEKRLAEELERASRQGTPVAVMMIDIDEFKAINDTFGHVAGDVIIRGVADVLRRSIRVFDVCARYGGEEFAIVMPGSTLDSAATIAERIRRRVEEYRPTDPAFTHVRVTVSIGLSESSAGLSAREVIEMADRALYTAKRSGKNQVRKSTSFKPA